MSAKLIALAAKFSDATADKRGRRTFSFDSYGLAAFAAALPHPKEAAPSAVDKTPNLQGRLVDKSSDLQGQGCAAPSEERWISVDARFPEREISVIGFWTPRDGKVHAGCYSTVCLNNYGVWVNPEDDDDEYARPTHWVPLPASPLAATQASTVLTDADEAFEDLYKRDRRDQSCHADLVIWRAGWMAGQMASTQGADVSMDRQSGDMTHEGEA